MDRATQIAGFPYYFRVEWQFSDNTCQLTTTISPISGPGLRPRYRRLRSTPKLYAATSKI